MKRSNLPIYVVHVLLSWIVIAIVISRDGFNGILILILGACLALMYKEIEEES